MTALPQRAAQGGCPSCTIAAGRTPAHIVHQCARLVAFLETAPIRPGHLRIVPRDHFPHFNALPPDLARELLDLGQRLAAAQRAVFQVDRVGFLFPAGEEPHAQLQAVPLLSAGDVAARRGGVVSGIGPRPAAEAQLAQSAAELCRWLASEVTARPVPETPLPWQGSAAMTA